MAKRSKVLVGDWEKLDTFIKSIPKLLQPLAKEMMADVAAQTAAAIKAKIRDYGMIRTGTYLRETNAYQDSNGRWWAGVPDKPHDFNDHINLRDLAFFLEMGTSHMAPRAHYRVVYHFEVPKIVLKVIAKHGFAAILRK